MQRHLLKFRSLYKYLIAALILAVPLYPKFPVFSISGTYVAVRLEDLFIGVTFLIFFLSNISDWRHYLKDRITLSILLFLGVGLLSVLSSILITNTVDPNLGFLHWIRRIEYLSMYFIGYSYIKKNPGEIHFCMRLFPLVILVAFIYGFGQKYLTWPIIITQNEEYAKGVALRYVQGSHINSTFAGHYDLATYLVLVLPLILSFVVGYKQPTESDSGVFLNYYKKINVNYLAIYSMGLWLLVNTASRISLVSFIIAATIALILQNKLKSGLVFILLSLVFIGFSSNLVARYQRIIQIFSDRIKWSSNLNIKTIYAETDFIIRKETLSVSPTPAPIFEDRSTSIRMNVEWPRAVRALTKNPILGTGYSSITLATDNDYLRMLGETGFLGFSSFLLILANISYPFLNYLKKMKTKNYWENVYVTSFIGGFSGILINAVFIDVFEASKFATMLWLVFGMMYAITLERSKINVQ